jgi:hypothetical protein
MTAIKPDDIISTLQHLGLIQYQKGQHVICAAPSLVDMWAPPPQDAPPPCKVLADGPRTVPGVYQAAPVPRMLLVATGVLQFGLWKLAGTSGVCVWV